MELSAQPEGLGYTDSESPSYAVRVALCLVGFVFLYLPAVLRPAGAEPHLLSKQLDIRNEPLLLVKYQTVWGCAVVVTCTLRVHMHAHLHLHVVVPVVSAVCLLALLVLSRLSEPCSVYALTRWQRCCLLCGLSASAFAILQAWSLLAATAIFAVCFCACVAWFGMGFLCRSRHSSTALPLQGALLPAVCAGITEATAETTSEEHAVVDASLLHGTAEGWAGVRQGAEPVRVDTRLENWDVTQ